MVLSNAGLTPDGLDQPGAQVLLGMRHDNDAGAFRVRENMVRTTHAVQHPTGLPQHTYQVGTLYVCMLHTCESVGKSGADKALATT